MTQLVLAQLEDVSVCAEILDSGRAFQRQQGFIQWSDHYPNADSIRQDIRSGNGYVLKIDGCIAAYLYIGFDGDPSYAKIRGQWHYAQPYAVVHRIAIDSGFRGTGLSDTVFRMVEKLCLEQDIHVLRIDTHAENKRMQHILEKNGFSFCGIVMQNGGERLAYDKKLTI